MFSLVVGEPGLSKSSIKRESLDEKEPEDWASPLAMLIFYLEAISAMHSLVATFGFKKKRYYSSVKELYILGKSIPLKSNETERLFLTPSRFDTTALSIDSNAISDIALGWRHCLVHIIDPMTRRNLFYSFGLNSSGQLGLPAKRSYDCGFLELHEFAYTPSRISMSAGRAHSSILCQYESSASYITFGESSLGALGHSRPGIIQSSLPFVNPPPGEAIQTLCGLDHTFICDSKELWGTGWNCDGQLGILPGQACIATLSKLFSAADPYRSKIKKIVSKADSSIILLEDGRLIGFGNSEYGQCMNGEKIDAIKSPREINFRDDDKVSDIAMGGSFSALLTGISSISLFYIAREALMHGRIWNGVYMWLWLDSRGCGVT
jgi:alpha-tubulin suppressor-like RCC1 family protein